MTVTAGRDYEGAAARIARHHAQIWQREADRFARLGHERAAQHLRAMADASQSEADRLEAGAA